MKQSFRILFTAMVCIAGAAFAQGPRQGGTRGGGWASMEQRRLDFLANALDLTDAQKTQAKTIFDNAAQSARTVMSAAPQRDALQTAIRNNDIVQIDQLTAAMAKAQGQAMAINAKAQAQFYLLLTPEQKAKYDKLGGGMGGPMGPMGPGGPGMMRGRGPARQQQ